MITELQTALYQHLAADPDLQAHSCEVYDEVPEGAAEPYVVLGEYDVNTDDTHDQRGNLTTVSVHVWSRYPGYAETARCLDAVVDALHRADVPVDGYEHVHIAHQGNVFQRDTDPALRHGIGRFEIRMTRQEG